MRKPFLKNSKGFATLLFVLGIAVITSLFLVTFSENFRSAASLQLNTLELQQKKRYLENFADYIQNFPAAEIEAFRPENLNGLDNRVTARLTREASEITGFLDHGGASPAYELSNGPIQIEWNQCGTGEEGVLALIGTAMENENAGCGAGEEYAERQTFLTPPQSFIVSSLTGFSHYRIKSVSGALLNDARWHLTLSIPLDYGHPGETLEIQRAF